MEYNVLKVEDIKDILEGERLMLPSNFNVLPFNTYLKIKELDVPKIKDNPNRLNILTRFYLDTIDEINEKLSETVIPFFDTVEEYQNQALLGYDVENFDSDMRYVGKNGPINLKEIINSFNRVITFSNEPHLIASSYDLTAYFKNSEK